ncbi:MAG: histidine--tRNA ligase [Peptoniphilaceae bacterium]|uniref:histidine--tRNA ligase n=1 Tax=Parvimonas sp. TaxID=1944660 RepID=UPI002A764689|nr:histidine--tRNA ligase [Parvimonas sp.]MDD7764506.1 histidine--tRNA ligase [Peptoniphilaceae bacterium]MDY3050485.1 histidine--tRNA ligase [Parvimonas sp.]
MGIIKPNNVVGTMELLPSEQILFDDIKNTIENAFKASGFLPIDTPVFEKNEVLFAKGGGETTKQIFKIDSESKDISLRFDLTVPLARYVAQHFSDLNFPFRRYHISKVYRGERNQKGRYKEFYQCDIDIIGNGKLDIRNDAELPFIIYQIFSNIINDKFYINFSNLKVINGFFEYLEIENKSEILRIIDKIEKIGKEKVLDELFGLGISLDKIEKISDFLSISGENSNILETLGKFDIGNEEFFVGVEELKKVYEYMKLFGVPEECMKINLSITRGLDYYTGTVYETFLESYKELGSICSGGRYDNLASNYTTQILPGVGISIGLTRLFYQLLDKNLFKNTKDKMINALIIPMENCFDYGIKLLNLLRNNGKIVQVYFEDAKMKKKISYADKLNIPFIIILGEDEKEKNLYTLKNLHTGEQVTVSYDELINLI